MKHRLQFTLTDETLKMVEEKYKEVTENFKTGSINYSDLLNEMILTSRVDIKSLQHKKANLHRSLRVMAKDPSIDIEAAIEMLNKMKPKAAKSNLKAKIETGVDHESAE